MISLSKQFALGLVAASAVMFSVTVGQAQQDADAVRTKCLQDLTRMYPNQQPDQTNRAALEYYITCMRSHGLTP
jgi:hypothetical protein